MEVERIYEEMVAEGLYPAWPKLNELTGSTEDITKAKVETDALWASLNGDAPEDGSVT